METNDKNTGFWGSLFRDCSDFLWYPRLANDSTLHTTGQAGTIHSSWRLPVYFRPQHRGQDSQMQNIAASQQTPLI
jgi:hypothetical protein